MQTDIRNPEDPETEAARWRAVLARDRSQDARFVYGVRSTLVYCRPSCPSRRPKRENVLFFPDAKAAARAGYRACLRCGPRAAESPEAALVARACALLE
ncbi:MAG: bifunctional transcriptional activator/DNA repair enzyme protein Ada, partial [Candidatus Methylomirabilis sp.]|nr:bifunctional transcriptional activator/DNA repair enzyme protein Ada [Deltaproteobacteria bacterium]